MTSSAEAATQAPAGEEGLLQRVRGNISAGNLGSWPVVIGLIVIVLFFSFKANNFFTPSNFTNIITQMAGVTMLAYGVVFVLLLGEIDLSISYIAVSQALSWRSSLSPAARTHSRAWWRS